MNNKTAVFSNWLISTSYAPFIAFPKTHDLPSYLKVSIEMNQDLEWFTQQKSRLSKTAWFQIHFREKEKKAMKSNSVSTILLYALVMVSLWLLKPHGKTNSGKFSSKIGTKSAWLTKCCRILGVLKRQLLAQHKKWQINFVKGEKWFVKCTK